MAGVSHPETGTAQFISGQWKVRLRAGARADGGSDVGNLTRQIELNGGLAREQNGLAVMIGDLILQQQM